MAGKKKVKRALFDGATDGLVGAELYAFVKERAPDVPNKKIVHVALMALTDPSLTDRTVMNVIYDLAIRYRLGEQAAEAAQAPRRSRTAKSRSGALAS